MFSNSTRNASAKRNPTCGTILIYLFFFLKPNTTLRCIQPLANVQCAVRNDKGTVGMFQLYTLFRENIFFFSNCMVLARSKYRIDIWWAVRILSYEYVNSLYKLNSSTTLWMNNIMFYDLVNAKLRRK